MKVTKIFSVALCAMVCAGSLASPAWAVESVNPPQSNNIVTHTDTGNDFRMMLSRAQVYVQAQSAKPMGVQVYTTESFLVLDQAYQYARQLGAGVSDEIYAQTTERLRQAIDQLTPNSWWIADHKDIQLHPQGSNLLKVDWACGSSPGTDVDVISSDGHKWRIHQSGSDTSTMEQFGITKTTRRYTAPTNTSPVQLIPGLALSHVPEILITASWSTGNVITANGNSFTLSGSTWKTNVKVTLPADNSVPASVRLSNGTSVPITWSDDVKSDVDGKIMSRSGVATGSLAGNQFEVSVVASRTYDQSIGINVVRSTANGQSSRIPVIAAGSKASELVEHKVLPDLDYAATADSYTISVDHGADVLKVDTRPGLRKGGIRTFDISITYRDTAGTQHNKTVHVEQGFKPAERKSDNPEAALNGIMVNGHLIDGWDRDVLDYTITAHGDEPYKISPKPADGQTVTAGDVRQTAYTTVQEWTVTKHGQSRVYSVSVVRPHTVPTADEAFKPSDPIDVDGKSTAPQPDYTGLKSTGFIVDGKYTVSPDDTYQIPIGGQFAYESFSGQTVLVSQARIKGMTWKYTLDVLSPDGSRTGQTVRTVTFITESTHRATLTGVRFDNKELSDFKPNVLEYQVNVNNPDQYTVTPLFDRQTGMSVSTHKNNGVAQVNVVSADGLEKTTYTFHVKATDKSNSKIIDQLPATGVTLLGLAITTGIALIFSIYLLPKKRTQ